MSAANIAVEVLLGITVAVAWLSCVGMLVMDDVLDALHYLAPVTTVASFALLAAVVVAEGAGQAVMKTILICIVLLLINAVLSHATARAYRIREKGDWKPETGESIDGIKDVPALRADIEGSVQ